jgi:hypothetical protein
MSAQAKRVMPDTPTDQPVVQNFRLGWNTGETNFVFARCEQPPCGYRLASVGALPERVPKKQFKP